MDDNNEEPSVFNNEQSADSDQDNTPPNILSNKQTRSSSMPNNDNKAALPPKVEVALEMKVTEKLFADFILVTFKLYLLISDVSSRHFFTLHYITKKDR